MPAYDDVLFLTPAPVARVTLRNPQTTETISDVSLLIDDVTADSATSRQSTGHHNRHGQELRTAEFRSAHQHCSFSQS